MSRQNTLLTSHKGVDLHAASALLVMKDRLEGGDRRRGGGRALVRLRRLPRRRLARRLAR
ncbi:hypothetical protein CSA17_04515 [bacterium DOLJORAL78_65_58]|nr:MAG: hypothetical protein CSA17_04515 [bacterium DOLJORAL78_65_58]